MFVLVSLSESLAILHMGEAEIHKSNLFMNSEQFVFYLLILGFHGVLLLMLIQLLGLNTRWVDMGNVSNISEVHDSSFRDKCFTPPPPQIDYFLLK
jgi:hypothetical protein